MKDRHEGFRRADAWQGSDRGTVTSVLAIGDMRQWKQRGGNMMIGSEVVFAEFADLDRAYLELIEPTIVLSPVFAAHFDCADLAVKLSDLGFTGSYRALGTDLPKPTMIEREIRGVCPTIDFAIVDMRDLYPSV